MDNKSQDPLISKKCPQQQFEKIFLKLQKRFFRFKLFSNFLQVNTKKTVWNQYALHVQLFILYKYSPKSYQSQFYPGLIKHIFR